MIHYVTLICQQETEVGRILILHYRVTPDRDGVATVEPRSSGFSLFSSMMSDDGLRDIVFYKVATHEDVPGVSIYSAIVHGEGYSARICTAWEKLAVVQPCEVCGAPGEPHKSYCAEHFKSFAVCGDNADGGSR